MQTPDMLMLACWIMLTLCYIWKWGGPAVGGAGWRTGQQFMCHLYPRGNNTAGHTPICYYRISEKGRKLHTAPWIQRNEFDRINKTNPRVDRHEEACAPCRRGFSLNYHSGPLGLLRPMTAGRRAAWTPRPDPSLRPASLLAEQLLDVDFLARR